MPKREMKQTVRQSIVTPSSHGSLLVWPEARTPGRYWTWSMS